MTVREKKRTIGNSDEKHIELKKLILFNDEFNTFDYVIKTLIEVCGHEAQQAETCAWIAHYRGKCAVKKGSFEDLKSCFVDMSFRNLTVEIQ